MTSNSSQNDGVGLKELILKIKEIWYEAWRNWWIIALFILAVLAFQVYTVFSSRPYYPAKLTFMVNEQEGGGGLGAMAGVLGNFGLGRGGDFNLEKMLELSKSRKIIQNVLLSKGDMNGKNDFYGNHLIKLYDYHEEWSEDTTGLNQFLFTHDSIPAFSRIENKVLMIMHARVIGNKERGLEPLLRSAVSENTGIMALNLVSLNEDISINLLREIYNELSEFYINKAIEKQKHTFDAIKSKADSLKQELSSAEYGLANFMDRNRGLYNKTDQLNQLRLEAKVKMLAAAWAKVEEQKEVAEFSLRDRTPIVQIIDLPIPPIKAVSKSLVKAGAIAVFLGTFLGLLLIIGKRVYKDVMND